MNVKLPDFTGDVTGWARTIVRVVTQGFADAQDAAELQMMYPIGTIVLSAAVKIPPGWHICDGAAGTAVLADPVVGVHYVQRIK